MRAERALALVAIALLFGCRNEPAPAPAADSTPATEGSATAPAPALVAPAIEALAVIELDGEGLGMDVAGDRVVAWSRQGAFIIDAAGTAERTDLAVDGATRDAALSASGLWMAEGSGARAALHRPSGRSTYALPAPAHDVWVDDVGEGSHAWFVTQGAEDAAVVALAGDGATVMREHVGRSPVALVPSGDGSRVAVASMRGRELTVFDVGAQQVQTRVPLSFSPVTLAWVGEQSVAAFPVGAGRAALVTLHEDGQPAVRERPIDAPTYLAAGMPRGSGLVAASTVAMSLVRYDEHLEVQESAPLTAVPYALAVGDVVWVADGSPAVVAYDATDLRELGRYALPAPATRLFARGEVAWALVPSPGLVATLVLSGR